MGKGKGGIEEWVKRLKRGSIIIEFNCSNINVGKNIWKILNSRLPIKTKMLSRKE
jgi:ribosomal protein L16/L10AE